MYFFARNTQAKDIIRTRYHNDIDVIDLLNVKSKYSIPI